MVLNVNFGLQNIYNKLSTNFLVVKLGKMTREFIVFNVSVFFAYSRIVFFSANVRMVFVFCMRVVFFKNICNKIGVATKKGYISLIGYFDFFYSIFFI
jgi:hypothetical protein